ncbi:MAG TPA: hypothetical protein VII36_10800, partial [Usitatibacter sp.]
VRVDDVEIDSSPPFGGRLVVHRLVARNVEVRTFSSKAAAQVPVSFKPPYPVTLEDGRIGTLRLGKIEVAAKDAMDPAARLAARERSRPKDLVLTDIVLKGGGDSSRWKVTEAAATTAYGDARLAGTLGNASPFAADLEGSFEGTIRERPVRITAKIGGALQALDASLEGTFAGTRATAKALITPFAEVPLKSVALNAADVDLSQLAAALPKTRMSLQATLAPEGKGFAGPVRVSNSEPGTWDRERLPFVSASARVAATSERADLTQLEIALLGGGSASGSATLARAGAEAKLQVSGVDLAALHGELQKTRIGGRVDLHAERGVQRFDVSLEEPRFAVQGLAALADEHLEVESARIVTGGGSVEGKGGVNFAGRKEFRFEGRAQHFDPSTFVKSSKGDLNFTFVTTGTIADGIAGEARIDIAASRYADLPAAGRIAIAGDRRRVASADIDLAWSEARLTAKGSFGQAGDVMQIGFRAPDLSAVAKPFGVQLAGRVEGTASLSGTFRSPAGRVSLTGANLALPSNVFVRELVLQGEAGVEPDSPVAVSLQARGV